MKRCQVCDRDVQHAAWCPRELERGKVTRTALRADPGAAMARAAREGTLTVVDADGQPRGVISVPSLDKLYRAWPGDETDADLAAAMKEPSEADAERDRIAAWLRMQAVRAESPQACEALTSAADAVRRGEYRK